MIDQQKIQTFDRDILQKIFKLSDPVLIKRNLAEYGLEIVNKKVIPMKEYTDTYDDVHSYWDKQQLVRKIGLNIQGA